MFYKIFRLLFIVALGFGLAVLSTPEPARAAGPWYVTTIGDDNNDCLSPNTACATINGAISKASSGDTVNVAIGTYTGTSGEVAIIDRDISISGGWDSIFSAQTGFSIIDGQTSRRGLTVNSSVIASLDRFIITNGFILNYGGGIYNSGTLTINNSSIHSNSISNYCYGGGIFNNNGTLTLNNTTISNNAASCNGGGIFVFLGSATLNNSTVSNNSVVTFDPQGNGAGIYNSGGSIQLNNTIIAGNTIASNAGGDCFGTPFTSLGNNIIGTTSGCDITTSSGDQFNIDPQLAPFLFNRGYYPLMSSSPAIDAGNPASCLPTDQRGVQRDTSCDIGAFEYTTPGAAESLSVAGGNNQQTTTSTAFPTPLQVAALDNQGNLVGGVTIEFTAPVSGPSGTFADTSTNLTSIVTNADGIATTSVFTANDQPGIYTVIASATGLGSVNFSMEQILRPLNDNFASAEVITALPFNATVDNTNATTEPGEPQGCSFGYRSVWYAFTPSETMAIQMDMIGSMVGGITDIYLASGSGISDLTFLTCTTTSSAINFSFEAGTTYYLRVDSFEQTSSLQVNLQQITTLPNDNFADAEVINSLPINVTVDNTNASVESGEPQGCSSVFRSVWYAFTPSENMTLQADMAGSVVSGSMSIFLASGSGISDLTAVTCASSGNSPNFQVEAGRTYYLRVDSSFGQAGSLQINLQQITSPSNDNFANAEVISSLPFNVTIDNTNATAEPNELMLGCSFPFRNVWYTFTPSENMAVQVDMVGSAVGGTVNILLASGPGITDLTSVACASTSNSSNFSFEAGKTYYLQVDSFGQAGSLQINLQQITPPVNDNFANAESISSLPFNVTVDNTNATFEPGEPQNCGSRFRSVWYTFTPSENMTVRADTLGSSIWASVDIYVASGPGISDLTFVKCTSSGGSSAGFQVEVGKTYYLRVDSFGQAGSLQLNLVQAIPPANDNFTSPETITALPFNETVNITDAGLEINEPQNCYYMYKTVWYSFTPLETMTVRMDTQGSAIGAGLNIYQPYGSGISEQNFLGCTAFTGSTTFLAEAGQTYYIQAGNIYGQDGTIQVNVNQVIPPTNDNFTNAQDISALPFNATVNITDATTEASEPQNCYFMNKTVWYSFTPTETIKVLADTQGSTVSGNMNIYRAETGFSDLQFMQCATPGSITTFLAEAGQTYYIQAGPAYGENGTIKINLAEMATITGQVTDAVTGAPLPGNVYPYALVTLQKDCGAGCFQNISSQYADSEGRFIFDSYYYGSTLSAGTYRIEASASLYQTKQSGLFEFTGTKLNLGDIPLNPPSTILGRAVDANTSNPLTGSVTLFRCNNGDCSEYVNSQYINDNGQFQFIAFYNGTGMSGGTYELEFVVPLYNTQRVQVVISDSEYRDLGDVPIVPLPHIGSIRGRLIDNATGQPVSPTFMPALNLYRCTNGGCEYVNSQVPDSQGRFNFNTDYNGKALIVGTYQIFAYADQYQDGQTVQFTVGEGDNPNLGNIRLVSLPVRFSEIQACNEIPATGGDCVYSVKVTNGLATSLSGTAWSLVNGSLPDAFVGYTEFQARDSKELDLAPGKSKVLQFRFLAPANNSSYGTYTCARIFVGQGNNSVFNTIGFRDLFCVLRNATGFTITAPQQVVSLPSSNVVAAVTATDLEPNNSCQAAQDLGAFTQLFTLDGDLDSSVNPDVDFFRFTGTPGAQVIVDLEGYGTGQGTLYDPFLGFFDSNCNLIALNDDSGGSLNSRMEITIPSDSVFVLAVTRCCDSGFYGGGDGTYQLTLTPIQTIGSISGRVTDAFTKKPLGGAVAPFAFVRLLRCEQFGCFDVNSQSVGSDGRFNFTADSNGTPLRATNYLLVISADQYHSRQTDMFAVGGDENYAAGDIALTSFPVRFSDVQACSIPTEGDKCEFSVKIVNGLSTRLTGKAWSMVNGYNIGSFTNFTAFQTDAPSDVQLDPGKSSVLRFRFRVRSSVADGAYVCATVFVGQGPSALFNTVGQSYLFCFVKGASGFTLMSVQQTQTTLQQMQIPEATQPEQQNKKNK